MQGRSSRGHERVIESREQGFWEKGGKQREKAASVSPHLAAFWLVVVTAGKSRQIQEYLCLKEYGNSALRPQTSGESWRFSSSWGHPPASTPSSLGNRYAQSSAPLGILVSWPKAPSLLGNPGTSALSLHLSVLLPLMNC